MNTVQKGDVLEEAAFMIIDEAVRSGRLGINPDFCKVRSKVPYFSKDRNSNIIFDLSIELKLAGATDLHLLYLIECKNYNSLVPVSDVEEFICKIQQVAGLNVKGIFMTNSDLQSGAFNLLKSKRMMWIKVDGDVGDIILYNKSRKPTKSCGPKDRAWSDEMSKIEEIKDLYSNEDVQLNPENVDSIISEFLLTELNASVNWFPGEEISSLEFLSKESLSEMSQNILNSFYGGLIENVKTVRIDSFMGFITRTYGVKFLVDVPFPMEMSNENGYFNRREKTIHVNPELAGTGQFAFVVMHEICHFILHSKTRIFRKDYEETADSKFDNSTGRYVLEKEKHWIEWQANYLASCLLMPRVSLMWKLVEWQMNNGISKIGSLWVDDQECNILAYQKAMTILAYEFGVSRGILEIRMADLGMVRYKNERRKRYYRSFGAERHARPIGSVIRYWADNYLKNFNDISNS
ncbi:Zn-dependent peptidase ImmA (M78 family) [Pedobacter sp. UYEF25]